MLRYQRLFFTLDILSSITASLQLFSGTRLTSYIKYCFDNMHGRWWQGTAYIQLLYRILLLYMLNQVPEHPAQHDLYQDSDTIERNRNRILSLKHEKDLAEALVYLAASTDDPKKIVALYLEEGTDHKCLYVRMAVNNGRLDKVERTFSKLRSILEEVARGSE